MYHKCITNVFLQIRQVRGSPKMSLTFFTNFVKSYLQTGSKCFFLPAGCPRSVLPTSSSSLFSMSGLTMSNSWSSSQGQFWSCTLSRPTADTKLQAAFPTGSLHPLPGSRPGSNQVVVPAQAGRDVICQQLSGLVIDC